MTSQNTPERPAAHVQYAPRYTLAEKIALAEELRRASFLPKGFNGNRANILYAIEYAEATGMHYMALMRGLFIIGNTPSANAGMIAALVRMAGHTLRVDYDPHAAAARCTIIRADDPTPTVVTWTAADALKAGLIDSVNSKGEVMARDPKDGTTVLPWEKYPRAHLKARALTECARQVCPEALYGIMYTPEELGAPVDADGIPLTTPDTAGPDTPPAPVVSAFRAQDGAQLAYAGADVPHISNVAQAADLAGQLAAEITAPDTRLPEMLHVFLLRTAALRAPDAATVEDIWKGAAHAGRLDEVIPGMEGADTQTLREYLKAAGSSLRASRKAPLPLAVQAAADAAAAEQFAEEEARSKTPQNSGAPDTDPDGPADDDPDTASAPDADPDPDTDSEPDNDGDNDAGSDRPASHYSIPELRAALGSGHPDVEAHAARVMSGRATADDDGPDTFFNVSGPVPDPRDVA